MATYTISYYDGNTAIAGLQPSSYSDGMTEAIALPEATDVAEVYEKIGYSLEGWYLDSSLTGEKQVSIAVGSTGNKTFYGKFDPVPVAVSLMSDGLSVGSVSCLYGSAVGTLPVPVKTGYAFKGWWTDYPVGSGKANVQVVSGTVYDATYDELVARWEGTELYLKLEVNAGEDETAYIDGQSEYVLPKGANYPNPLPTAKWTGHTFGGWYTEEVGGSQIQPGSSTGTQVGNLSIYAHWGSGTYTVTLDKNGGTGGTNSVSATYGEAMPTEGITAPTKTGYAFGGYYLTPAFEKQYYTPRMTSAHIYDIAGAATLYAKWTANTYTITFKSEGTTVKTESVAYGGLPYDSRPADPAKANYVFSGWYTGSGASESELTQQTVCTGDATYTARFESVTAEITVTFVPNGGRFVNPSKAKKRITVNTEVGELPTLQSRAGYGGSGVAQYGWYYIKPGKSTSTVEEVTSSTVLSADTTVFASWTSQTFTITLNGNGGTFPPNGEKTKTISNVKMCQHYGAGIAAFIPQMTGHTFAGWWKRVDGVNTVKLPEDPIFSEANSFAVYAEWIANESVVKAMGTPGAREYDGRFFTIACKPELPGTAGSDPCSAVHQNDIYLSGNSIAFAFGKEAMGQLIRSAILTYRGELQYDQERGIPYWETIFAHRDYLPLWKNAVTERIRQFAFVKSVGNFKVDIDYAKRKMTYSLDVDTDEGSLTVESGM